MSYSSAAVAQKINSMSSGILKGHFIYNREYNDALLKRQFGAAVPISHNMTYEFSKDAAMLNSYYNVRDAVYKEISGLTDYSFLEDEYDRVSDILVAKNGRACIGGARLTISSQQEYKKLPIETEEFKVADILSGLGIHDVNYCEMSRVAVMPEYRNGAVFQQITQKMHNLCIQKDVAIGFACNTHLLARRFKMVFADMGYEMIIRDDIKIPHQESHGKNELILTVVDFTHDRRYHNLLKVADIVKVAQHIENKEPEFA